jgi:hypothetical protein
LTGIATLRIVAQRAAHRSAHPEERSHTASTGRSVAVLLAAVALHGSIVVVGALSGHVELAGAWLLGVVSVFPTVNRVRQLLEHRDVEASRSIDYTAVPHGAFTRMFRPGPLTAVIGAAGFDRHALHHWDPGVSCTRLPDLDRFLMDTELRPTLEAARTTYTRAAFELAGR